MYKFIALGLVVLISSGCITTQADVRASQIHKLNTRVSDLEKRLAAANENIVALQTKLDQKDQVPVTKAVSYENAVVEMGGKFKVNTSQFQTALQRAGYYEGPIDGKIGRKTQDAVRAFQKANGLKVDGVVGFQTWEKLKEYHP